MKKRFLSPVYFVIAVYALLAAIGFFELRCLANDAANQSRPLALNKVEDWKRVIGAAGGALTGAVIAGGKAWVVGEETIYEAP